MRTFACLMGLLSVSSLVACSNTVGSDPAAGGQDLELAPGARLRATGEAGAGAAPELAASCDASGGAQLVFEDEADALAQLVGRWVLCRGPGLPFAKEQREQAGIELDANMTWYLLTRAGDSLVRAEGFEASDSYRFQPPQDLELGPSKQMLLFFGVDYSFANATMLDSPRTLRMTFGTPLDQTPSFFVRAPEQ